MPLNISQVLKQGLIRIKDNAVYEQIETNEVPKTIHIGVLLDAMIELEVKEGKAASKLQLRKIKFYDRENKRKFESINNLFDL